MGDLGEGLPKYLGTGDPQQSFDGSAKIPEPGVAPLADKQQRRQERRQQWRQQETETETERSADAAKEIWIWRLKSDFGRRRNSERAIPNYSDNEGSESESD
ncbi:unnamed protein product [[Candida] boidinii]|nr:unnamed protein product [[Candida] boidinii]